MKKQCDIKPQALRLVKDCASRFEISLNTSSDYQRLADNIVAATKVRLSPTTLKRIGGYLRESATPRLATLDILARALGYKDFDDYCNNGEAPDSNPSLGEVLESRSLKVGECLKIIWGQNHYIVAQYSGADSWHIIKAEGTRLKEGIRFLCPFFVQGEATVLQLLDSGATAPYAIGRHNGIRYLLVDY